jgi:hypothetical protein
MIQLGIPNKLVRLINMCPTEMYSRGVEKNLSDMFPVRNGLKQDALLPLFFNFVLEVAIRMVQLIQDELKLKVLTRQENVEALVQTGREWT